VVKYQTSINKLDDIEDEEEEELLLNEALEVVEEGPN